MKIYSTSGVELHDVVVTRDAKHEQELMKSDFVSLKWSDVDSYIIPTGSYIIPFADGIRYTLFGDCLPIQKNEGEYVYEPQFQHPKMILAHTPCLLATKNAAGEDVKDTDWTFVGGLATLLDGMQKIIHTELGKDFNFSIINAEDIAASASCTFSGVDILSAFTEICNQFECEYYVDWSNAFIYFGHIKRDMAITTPVLEVGVNINVPTINRNNEEVANCFIVRGGTRNITTKTASGNNVETDTRLTLDTAVYGADSIIDKRTDENQPKLVKTLIFDHIYPHLDLYVYDVRKRTRRLEDKNGKYIQNPDGTYKKYSIYYIKLAYKEGLEWKDFTSATREHIVNGKKLMASFEPNEGKGHSALAGREFEMIFHPQPVKINKNEAVEDTGIDIGKDYYEICYQQENDLILPNDDTLEPWGEATPSENGDKVVLFNILMGEEYLSVARVDLLEAANKEIVKLLADNNIYNVKSNPVTYDKNLSLGQHVIIRNVDGSEIDSRITKVVTQLDIPSQVEFTIGTDILKGATQTLREDVKSISSKIGIISNSNSVSSAIIQQILRALQDAEERMLHKDSDDETPFRLTADKLDVVSKAIMKGWLESENFANSMTNGRGWGVDSIGNMQVESLEVRSALRVLELVYNRLSAEESEYVFTESGTIKEIETLGGGRYKIIMDKRGDTDFHAFRVGDVLRGIVNDLTNLGGGEYYTTWLHVESIDPHGDNSMVVSMYADSDCPSNKNYPPTDLMVIQRWGNSIPATKENHENPEYRAIIDIVDGKYVNRRQSCWYLSSNEKRIVMLDDVSQPILTEGNYAAFFGLPYDLRTFKGHSMDMTQPYLYVRGAFLQDIHFIDYKGNVVKQERYRGVWSEDVAKSIDPYVVTETTFDTVYWNNAKWQCKVAKAKYAPSVEGGEWELLQAAVDGEDATFYRLTPSATTIKRDSEGYPYVTNVTCIVEKITGSQVTLEPDDNLYCLINGIEMVQTSSVELTKDDEIESLEFILMPEVGAAFDEAVFDVDTFAVPLATASVSIVSDGANGKDGKDGASGSGISEVVEEYGVSTDADILPTQWADFETAQSWWDSRCKYLWNRETTYYSGDKDADVNTHIVAIYAKDGEQGRGIKSITNYYKSSNKQTGESRDEGTWYENPASAILSRESKYLWNYEKVTYTDNTSTFTEPSIIGVWSEGIKGERGAILRGPSEWSPTVEYQGGNNGEEYQDMVVRTIDGVTEYFLCRYTHTGIDPHDASHQANANWNADKPWQKSQVSDFVATKILYSEQIKAEILNVVQERVDDLIVGRLQTMATGGATITIEQGLMQVSGPSGNVNIQFGVNDQGYAVLRYYNMDGDLLYDLGPEQIMSQVSETWSYSRSINLYKAYDDFDSIVYQGNFAWNSKENIVVWSQGSKRVGRLINYTAYRSKPLGLQDSQIWQETPFAYNGKVVYPVEDGVAPSSGIDGFYLTDNLSMSDTQDGLHTLILNDYVDGAVRGSYKLYLRKRDGHHFFMADQYGVETSYNMTLMEYLEATGQIDASGIMSKTSRLRLI